MMEERMEQADYPALYISASRSSASAQRSYLWLIRCQYLLLIAAALVALWYADSTKLLIAYVAAVIGSTALLLFMSVRKPEQDWYACRALAESVKTSAWRYMMRAEPFGGASENDSPRDSEGFASLLQQILDANESIGPAIASNPSDGDQITARMKYVRAQSLKDRVKVYCADRIDEQREWYNSKVKQNKRNFMLWITLCVLVQAAAILSAVWRVGFNSDPTVIWPTEPLLVTASAIVGWIQIKKFNELASAYSLTAQEIGIVRARADAVSTEAGFSDFVNEAERAFSREHTQWSARVKG